MEEFIFGTFATDERKLFHARAQAQGLQHQGHIVPQDPLPGQPVKLVATVGPDLALDHLACYYTTDGQTPSGSRGTPRVGQAVLLERAATEWHPFLWGYVERWEGTIPPQPEGTVVRYRIGGWRKGSAEIWADRPTYQEVVDQAVAAFFAEKSIPQPGDLWEKSEGSRGETFAYGVDRLAPPDWAREAVVYQVFLDRFNPGGGQPFTQAKSLRDFHGGTLAGVTEKLDYIADLGATCIWLSPCFASPTYHGYDTTDYYTVEPRLGSNDDLRQLVREAHARGIRVLLDLVCNHMSDRHPFFQEARSDPSSPYRQWFTFDDAYPHNYRTFFGVAAMPKLNTAHPAVRDYMVEVARHWLTEYDVDGFRLDHANGPTLPFWTDFWVACKAAKPDCWCFGEIVEPPTVLERYAGRLDGCLDFHLCDLLRRAFAYGSFDLNRLEQQLNRHERFFSAAFSRPAFFDNHDMDRFLYTVGGDQRRLKLATLMLMTLPGPPVIYYGTEVGLSQADSARAGLGLQVSRLPMPWDNTQDKDLLAWYRRLIEIRRSHSVIWRGRRTTLHVGEATDEATWVYALQGDDATLIVALNNSAAPQELVLDVSGLALPEGTSLHSLLEGGENQVQGGRLELSLPPWSGGIWKAM